MKKGLLVAILAVGALTPCFASPDLMIVQIKLPAEKGEDPNLVLSPYVAEELDKEGRVRPVVWSTVDPVFLEWTEKANFGGYDPNPCVKLALSKAQKLGVTYVLTLQARKTNDNFVAIAELFENGRSKWRFGPRNPNKNTDFTVMKDGKLDEKATRAIQAKMTESMSTGGTFTVYTGSLPDWDATARSLASTWRALLGEGPFASLPKRLRTTEADKNDTISLSVNTKTDAKADNVVEVAQGLVAKGKLSKALTLLREACDTRPFEVKIRKYLAELLIESGMATEAAGVAQAAARIQPADPSLWLTVAQAWVAAGDPERALQALKEAQTRGSDGPTMNRVSADIALLNGDPKRAAEHYSKAEGTGSKVRLAVCLALLGDVKGSQDAMSGLGKLPLSSEDYVATVLFVDQSMQGLAKTAADVPPTVRIHPGEKQTLAAAELVSKQCVALRELMTNIVPPKIHAESHEARKLAHILLAQATLEALQFANTNDPDIGEETVATLGQALHLFPSVKEKFRLEQRYGGF